MTPRRSVLRAALSWAAALIASGRGAGLGPAFAAERVDLLLVLAIDVSRSISDEKFALERNGYVEALRDPQVLKAIAGGPEGRIALAIVEWAAADEQRVVVDWTLLSDAASARAAGAALAAAPRSFYGRTAIGTALAFCTDLLARAPYGADKRVIDVSGDGTSNQGQDIRAARDAATADGATTINGIVILTDPVGLPAYLLAHTNPPGGLASYYRETVIGGPGAFVMTAENFETFGRSLVAKLVKEIS